MTEPENMCPEPIGAHPPLSRLGLGAWAFGRTGWGIQHDRDSQAAILRAVELGVTWIEKLVGRTLSELSEAERPMVFTKGGVKVDRSSGTTYRDLRGVSLRRECEASLRRLGVERVDLYQLHWPVDDPAVIDEAWGTLGELQDEGKIRWAGVSNFDVPLLDRCAGRRPIDAAQVSLSLLSRDSGRDLLPWVVKHGVQALVYSPLESGLLSGGFSMQRLRSLPASDWRSKREQFQQPQLDRTLDLLERLEPIAAGLGASLTEMAIAWTLAWPGVGATIVGARTAEQVDGWAGASNLILDEAALDAIENALLQTEVGSGPAHPHRGTQRPITA